MPNIKMPMQKRSAIIFKAEKIRIKEILNHREGIERCAAQKNRCSKRLNPINHSFALSFKLKK
jgi:hypothetical protein